MKFRKVLTLLLVLSLLLGLFPVSAQKAPEEMLEPDVIVAQASPPYYHFFGDIVNVPAEVYHGAAPNGKLIVNFFKNTVHSSPDERYPLGSIWSVESLDDGRTWSEPRELLSYEKLLEYGIGTEELPVECRDPNLALLSDGTILMTFFTRRYATDRFLRVYLCESPDGGEHWTAPQEVVCNKLDGWLAKRGNIAVLENDEILIPVYGGTADDKTSCAAIIRGVREGAGRWSWTEEILLSREETLDDTAGSELSLIYVGDDTVYGLIRPGGQFLVSHDRGSTWEVADRGTALSQPGLIRIDENRVFATWSRPSEPRFINGKMFDIREGYDWNSFDSQLIYTGPNEKRDMADPSAVLTNDGQILTIYYDTRLRAIGGTFTPLSDWDAPDPFRSGVGQVLLNEDFDLAAPGEEYAGSALTVEKEGSASAIVLSEEDNQCLALAGAALATDPAAGDLDLTFDFRFPGETGQNAGENPAEPPELRLTFADTAELAAVLRPDAVGLQAGDIWEKELSQSFLQDTWYSARLMRLGNRIYWKTAPKGQLEAADWTYIYTADAVKTAQDTLRIKASAGELHLDNLRLSGAIAISIAEETLEAHLGEPDVQLTLAGGQGHPVSWSSSDASVATVSDTGLVRFLKKGTTQITARLGDSSDTCTVIVTEPYIELDPDATKLAFFTEDFESCLDEAYTGELELQTGAGGNTAAVKSEGENRYLQLSGSRLTEPLTEEFENETAGQKPADVATVGNVTVREMAGSNCMEIASPVNDKVMDYAAWPKSGQATSQKLTVSFKVYIEEELGGKPVIVKLLNGTDAKSSADTAFMVRFYSNQQNGTGGYINYYDGAASHEIVGSGGTISVGKWQTVRLECTNQTATDGELKIYIDGVYVGSATKTNQNNYGANTADGVKAVSFEVSGSKAAGERFCIGGLSMEDPTQTQVTLHYPETIEGSYLCRFDFRYPADAQGKLQLSMLLGNRDARLVLDQSGLSLEEHSETLASVPRALTAGTWYTWQSLRMGNRLYAKVWERGGAEPETWDLSHQDVTASPETTRLRLEFLPAGSTPELVDLDQFTLLKAVQMALSQTELAGMPGADPVQLSILTGASLQAPDAVWASTDEDVATVSDSGLVSFVGVGQADVTATVKNAVFTCHVTVSDALPADYSGVESAKEKLETLTEADYTAASWQALKDAVDAVVPGKLAVQQAEVDAFETAILDALQGLVYANQPELNEVLAQAARLSRDAYLDVTWAVLEKALALPQETNGEMEAKISAIQAAIDQLVPAFPYTMQLSQTSLQRQPGAAAVVLSAAFQPALPVTPELQWISDDPSVASVDENGRVEFHARGVTIIRATAGGHSASCLVSVQPVQVVSEGGGTTAPAPRVTKPTLRSDLGEHAYIAGFPDKTFRPEEQVTRGQMAQMLSNLIVLEGIVPSHSYSDVKGTWADYAVGVLCSVGVLEDGTGSFRMDQPATRGEFAQAVCRILGIRPEDGESFDDMEGHALAGYFAALKTRRILQGYPDGTARPDQPMTRAEMVVIINRAVGLKAAEGSSPFTDVAQEHWAFGDILAAGK